MDRERVGKWSEHLQAPDPEDGTRFTRYRNYGRREGYRFVHVHLYTVDGLWWIDLEMERI